MEIVLVCSPTPTATSTQKQTPETKIQVQVVYLGGNPRKHCLKSKTGKGRLPVKGMLSSKWPLWTAGAQSHGAFWQTVQNMPQLFISQVPMSSWLRSALRRMKSLAHLALPGNWQSSCQHIGLIAERGRQRHWHLLERFFDSVCLGQCVNSEKSRTATAKKMKTCGKLTSPNSNTTWLPLRCVQAHSHIGPFCIPLPLPAPNCSPTWFPSAPASSLGLMVEVGKYLSTRTDVTLEAVTSLFRGHQHGRNTPALLKRLSYTLCNMELVRGC